MSSSSGFKTVVRPVTLESRVIRDLCVTKRDYQIVGAIEWQVSRALLTREYVREICDVGLVDTTGWPATNLNKSKAHPTFASV